MRKWAFIYVVAAVAVVGCGGTGSGTKTAGTGSGGGVTNPTGIRVKLTNGSTTPPGGIDVAFLTGQGRAPGDLIAIVKRIFFDDNYGEVTNPASPETACPLIGFQNNVVHLDVDFLKQAPGVPSRQFTAFNLDFLRFDQETSVPGNLTSYPAPVTFPAPYPAKLRVFPGRISSLPVYIDDSMFTVDTSGTTPVIAFNEAQFKISNGATASNPIRGFLSDMVAFNVSGMPAVDKATIGSQAGFGGPVDRVFFSGDVYAMSDGHTSGSTFAALTQDPTLQINGRLGAAGSLNGPGGTLPHPGTYSLLALDPTDITQQMKIVAGQGIWREHSSVLAGLSTKGLNVVTFPSSNDDNQQEMVAFTQDASGNVTSLYFGYVDLDALTFNLYPLLDLVSGTTVDGSGNSNGVSGTLSTLYTVSGAITSSPDLVRNGLFKITTVPSGAAYPQPPTAMATGTAGTFYVFRL